MSTMKRVEFDKYGKREVMRLNPAAAAPVAGEKQVLVRVRAASLNPVDFKLREGALKAISKTRFPSGIAYDLAGEVVAVGPGVEGFQAGDRVMARSLKANALAELAAVDVAVVTPLPAQMDFVQGAALPLAGMTALQSLRDAGLKEGETVLILGGAGGVGTFAVQLARHVFGASKVVATCSPAKASLVTGLGAHETVDYRDAAAIAKLPKFDVIFDAAGEAKRFGHLIKSGRVVASVAAMPDPASIARSGRKVPAIVRAFLWFASRPERRAAARSGGEYHYVLLKPNAKDLAELGGYVVDGKLKCVIDSTFQGIESFQDAFAKIESGRAAGKVVVVVAA